MLARVFEEFPTGGMSSLFPAREKKIKDVESSYFPFSLFFFLSSLAISFLFRRDTLHSPGTVELYDSRAISHFTASSRPISKIIGSPRNHPRVAPPA